MVNNLLIELKRRKLKDEFNKLRERMNYCSIIKLVYSLKRKIKRLKKKARDGKIAEDMILSVICRDSWDLSGDKKEVMDDLELTSKEYNFLRRRLGEDWFRD